MQLQRHAALLKIAYEAPCHDTNVRSARVLWLQSLHKGFGNELRSTLRLLHETHIKTFEHNAQLDHFHIEMATKAWTVYQEIMPNLELSLQDKCALHMCKLLCAMLKQCQKWSEHFEADLTDKRKWMLGSRRHISHLDTQTDRATDAIRWSQRMREVRTKGKFMFALLGFFSAMNFMISLGLLAPFLFFQRCTTRSIRCFILCVM